MSNPGEVCVYFDHTGHAGVLGTLDDWAAFGVWLSGLDETEFYCLHSLWTEGWDDDLEELEEQLELALSDHPSVLEAAEDVAEKLLDIVIDRGAADRALALSTYVGQAVTAEIGAT